MRRLSPGDFCDRYFATMKHRKPKPKAERSRESVRRRLGLETLCERRVLAAVSGVVFDDVDSSWRPDAGETALSDRLVFVDANDNGLPDDGEPFALTDVDGSFSLTELGGDEQIVRLFSAAESQRQHFVVRPEIDPDPIALSTAANGDASFSRDGNSILLLTDAAVILVDLAERSTVTTDLEATPRAAVALDDDRWLILASDDQGNHAFLLSASGELLPTDLFADDESALPQGFDGWADLVIDRQGDGLILPRSGDEASVPLYRISTAESGQSSAAATATEVVPGAQLFAGEITSVIAEPLGDDAFDVTLWSNATGSPVGDGAVTIDGSQAVLGYSDSLNLLFVSLTSSDSSPTPQSILVLDAAAQFAPLMTIDGLDDSVAIDLGRGVIFSYSTTENRLRAIDAISSQTIADWDLELPAPELSEPAPRLLIAPGGDQLVMLMSTGVVTVPLRSPDAHRIQVDGSRPLYPLRFAVRVSGDNSPPHWTEPLEFTVTQGDPLTLAEGTLLSAAGDDDGDPFVVLRASDPLNGQASVTPGGAMSYVPDPEFIGTDSFELLLHDGRGVSLPQSVQINVIPAVVPDPVIVIELQSLPENAPAGFILGTVETIGLGDGPVVILVDDPRFEVVDQQIVVVEGAVFDSEQEFQISTTITASNQAGDLAASSTFTIGVLDPVEPIEDIQPRSAEVLENVAGERIAELFVIDHDSEQTFSLTVDDDRFEIVDRNLQLKPGVSLDYEESPTVIVHITATGTVVGDTLTVPFEVFVIDQPEQAGSITAGDLSVTEFVSGDVAGMIRVDGNPLRDSYIASVDDSRFEVVNGALKLRAGHYLDRSDQQDALVVVTVQDTFQVFPAVSQSFLVEVLANENPFHNPDNPFDVNGDGAVTPLDALLILNALQQNGGGGPISQFPPPGRYWDVNGDGMISPLDALLILNFINQQNRPPVVGEPEVSPPPTEPPIVDPPPLSPPGTDESRVEPPLAEAESDVGLSPQSTSRSAIPLADDVDAFAAQLARSDESPTDDRRSFAAADSFRQTDLAADRWRRESARMIDSWATDLQTLRRHLIARLTENDWDALIAQADNLRHEGLARNWLPQIEAALTRLNRL